MEESTKKKMLKEMFNVWINCMDEEAHKDADVSDERRELTKKKYKLLFEQHELEEQLESVTKNAYEGIGAILNDLLVDQNKLLQGAYEKCKKYLDDNNLPYVEEGCEEDDEEDDD